MFATSTIQCEAVFNTFCQCAIFLAIFDQPPPAEIQHLMEARHHREYLFPDNSMLLDEIPVKSIPENIPLLFNYDQHLFSNVCCNESSPSGLFSAGSIYQSCNPLEAYTIDVFGTDVTQLENHVVFHVHRALQTTHGEFCLQIYVEKGYIAQELS
ncbi:hypothetical protein DPMN_070135 [Dreissena polymorpha]|uniref:Histidine N-acetyltransferase C-terminal domain-containing protein n=1 Tax=Dreissena polymorpha TaxID=45954 RepID=A0A9D4BUW8_DREPO|nr:hypothetical protein DPMN_070135 [Dreissena polymorpha]